MRILIACTRLTPPFFLGGVEVNNRIVADEASASGHDVFLLGSFTHPRWGDNRELGRILGHLDDSDEVDVTHQDGEVVAVAYRARSGRALMVNVSNFEQTLTSLIDGVRPDLVLTSCAGAMRVVDIARRMAVPTLAWVQDSGEDGAETHNAGADRTIYVSQYLRQYFSPSAPVRHVVPPSFEAPRTTAAPLPDVPTVLMINPIPEKGSTLFLQLAEMLPDVRFLGLTGWRRPEWADKPHPANVVCLPRTDSPESAYAEASVVIVPSVVAEGFGRVPVEAALHRRRAFCHRSGALPESSGNDRNLLDCLDAVIWEKAIRDELKSPDLSALGSAVTHANQFVRPILPELIEAMS